MSGHGQQLSVGDVSRFVLAGKATFTVVRPARTRKVVRQVGGVGVETCEDVPAARYTFKLARAKGDGADRPWFAKVLTGSDNETSYTFVGSIFPTEDGPSYRHSFNKSPISQDAPSVRCLAWLLDGLNALAAVERTALESKLAGDLFAPANLSDALADALDVLGKVEVWHEGSCGRCGRKLTVPESIANGLGPECAEKVGAA